MTNGATQNIHFCCTVTHLLPVPYFLTDFDKIFTKYFSFCELVHIVTVLLFIAAS